MPGILDNEDLPTVRIGPPPVAPWPHTVFIVAVLALWAIFGALISPVTVVANMPRGAMYAFQMVTDYLLVGSTIAGLYHRRQFIAGVTGSLPGCKVFGEIGKGFLVFLCASAVMVVLGILLRPTHLTHNRAAVSAVGPHSSGELAIWILVSLTAGLCEEFIFRGYLLQQLRGWFGNAGLAVAVSALLFGSMHFYEGSAAVVQICGLGALYGVVAVRRGNLRSVIIAHFFQDAIAGLVLFLRR
jgi:membrane protease YdiL (CAAX protease family)